MGKIRDAIIEWQESNFFESLEDEPLSEDDIQTAVNDVKKFASEEPEDAFEDDELEEAFDTRGKVEIHTILDPATNTVKLSDLDESLSKQQKARKAHEEHTREWEANEGRQQRVKAFKSYAGLDEDFDVTEDDWNNEKYRYNRALVKTHNMCGHTDLDRIKAEVLRQPYTGLEDYENWR